MTYPKLFEDHTDTKLISGQSQKTRVFSPNQSVNAPCQPVFTLCQSVITLCQSVIAPCQSVIALCQSVNARYPKALFHNLMLLMLPLLMILTLLPAGQPAYGQVTGLSDWTLFIDPGHSRTENMGLYNYSEAEKVLEIGLMLREMLTEQTDIDAVYMARTTHTQQVSLTQRTNHANSTGADFYYSIHSDAGSPHVNSTLMLYGGWRSGGQTVEKTPEGGRLFGAIMDTLLTNTMRIGRRGNFADRTFYQGFPENHANQWPYLHVNRTTNMASLLSEAGFHTNPTQQQRNMNWEWKRLEAKSAFWTILDFHDIERPEVGIVAGYITDSQSGETLNGINVTIGDQTYTTDTFESLFNRFSNDPDELSNGFYYIDGLEPGGTVEVTFGGPTHFDTTLTVSLNRRSFTFLDVQLDSRASPQVVDAAAYTPLTALTPGDEIEITFSRIPDPDSFDDAVAFDPEVPFETSWKDEYTLVITTDSLDFETDYTLTIRDVVVDKVNGNALDGNKDGNPGGDYILEFRTSGPDLDPPLLVYHYPSADEPAGELRPVIRLVYDETVMVGSLSREAVTLTGDDGSIRGSARLDQVGRQSILHFFPESDLKNNSEYTVTIQSGLADRFGNTTASESYTFETDAREVLQATTIDNFNSGISGWWHPQQSGSTTGIVTESTSREHETTVVNHATGSTGSMRLGYGWIVDAPTHLLRQYLPPTASQNRQFSNQHILQAYIFGDGSGNRFRFMLRDGNNQLEGSQWYDLDWLGWKLVSWDLANDPVVGWVNGNGILDGLLRTDSFQLTKTADGADEGVLYIDDYRFVQLAAEETSGSDLLTDLPHELTLEQNYPNPFNPVTQIAFTLPEHSEVTLEVFDMLGRRVALLVSESREAGRHEVSWDASRAASGVYVYRLQAGTQVLTRKMTLVK